MLLVINDSYCMYADIIIIIINIMIFIIVIVIEWMLKRWKKILNFREQWTNQHLNISCLTNFEFYYRYQIKFHFLQHFLG